MAESVAALPEFVEGTNSQNCFGWRWKALQPVLLMVDELGIVVLVNAHSEGLFCYSRQGLLGQRVETLVLQRFGVSHPEFASSFPHEPRARPMGQGHDLYGRRKDGCEFAVEIDLNPMSIKEGRIVLSSVVDIKVRERAEAIDLARVNFSVYPQALAEQLEVLFEPGEYVFFEASPEAVHLPADVAIPCGLLVNELVTHAFALGRRVRYMWN